MPGIVGAVARAAAAVRRVYDDTSYTVTEKTPNDPLTSADLLANDMLREGLSLLLPEAAWLSEESPQDGSRLQNNVAWVVDPIDGTREFVGRIPEFAVSVGLSVGGEAVAGFVALPAEARLIAGAQGVGIETYQILSDGRVGPPNQLSVALSEDLDVPSRARVLFSRSEQRAGLGRQLAGWQLFPSGSIARKLALVAAGEADLCVSLRPKNEWDICGGVALILAGGGRALELEPLTPHRFNQADTRSYGLAAGPPAIMDAFLEWSRQHKLSVDKNRS